MAKSKQQKQQEAIERNRKNFPKYIRQWTTAMPGGETYKKDAERFGIDFANRGARDAEAALIKAAREASVDRYGTPLDTIDQTFLAGLDRARAKSSAGIASCDYMADELIYCIKDFAASPSIDRIQDIIEALQQYELVKAKTLVKEHFPWINAYTNVYACLVENNLTEYVDEPFNHKTVNTSDLIVPFESCVGDGESRSKMFVKNLINEGEKDANGTQDPAPQDPT